MNKCSRLLSWRRLAIGVVYCQTKATNPDKVEQPIVIELNQITEQLTHKYLLQQTCTISVNSSCQMITIAQVALVDASQKYKDVLIKSMDLLEPNDLFDNKLEDDFMESRYDIANAKSFYLDSISAMKCALQLGRSNALMAYTVEANTVLNSMSEKLYSAEKEFQSCIEEIRKLEDKFTKLLADSIKTTKNKENLEEKNIKLLADFVKTSEDEDNVVQRCRRHHCKRWSSSMSTVFSGDDNEGKQILKPSYEMSEIHVELRRGLPSVTVPLPSRRELCQFTLRPVTNTVGDLTSMLKTEDPGVDRVVVSSSDGVRIASSNTIESLMEEDFRLTINDRVFTVKVPPQKKLTKEEMERLSGIRTLVSQLYESLNVEEHQLKKERELLAKMEELKVKLEPLEKKRQSIDLVASRQTSVLTWVGLGLMSVQFGILARLTWWEYSWDIMEPVTYFVTYGTAMAVYAYYVLTKQEYLMPDVRDRQYLITMHKKARKSGLDLHTYNLLKDKMASVQTDLARLKDPLVPPHRSQVLFDPLANCTATEMEPTGLWFKLRTRVKSLLDETKGKNRKRTTDNSI